MTQPPDASPPPPRSSLWREIAERAFAFAGEAPWKAVVVIVVLILGFICWIIYEKRDDLIEAYLTPSAPQLADTSEVAEALEALVKEIDVDLVQVWRVDASRTGQDFVAARRKDGDRPVIPEPRHLPIMDEKSDPRMVAVVMRSYPLCKDLTENGGPLEQRLYARDFRRGCVLHIPALGRLYVGLMYLVWVKPQGDSAENVAREAARGVADKLATH